MIDIPQHDASVIHEMWSRSQSGIHLLYPFYFPHRPYFPHLLCVNAWFSLGFTINGPYHANQGCSVLQLAVTSTKQRIVPIRSVTIGWTQQIKYSNCRWASNGVILLKRDCPPLCWGVENLDWANDCEINFVVLHVPLTGSCGRSV